MESYGILKHSHTLLVTRRGAQIVAFINGQFVQVNGGAET